MLTNFLVRGKFWFPCVFVSAEFQGEVETHLFLVELVDALIKSCVAIIRNENGANALFVYLYLPIFLATKLVTHTPTTFLSVNTDVEREL